MALNFKHFWEGIKIKAKSILTSDTKGELEVDDTTGKLNYHDGSVRSPVVTEKSTATLTNKTFDANGTGNSISNIETADLAAGVLNTSTSMASASNTQVPSALAIKTYVDNGLALQNDASEISYNNATSGLTATNVQSAIDEVEGRLDTAQTNIAANATNLSNHISSTTAHSAANITNTPSGNLAATNVQAALNELQSDVDTRATSTALSNHASTTSGTHGVTGNIVGTTDSQTLSNKSLVDTTTAIVDATDNTKKIKFDSNGATGTDTIIRSSSTVGRVLVLPDADGTLLVDSASQNLSNKNFLDSSTNIVDFTDNTKKLNFDVQGTTGVTTTIISNSTSNQALTLPDATDTIAVLSAPQTMSNKTFIANNSTFANITDTTKKFRLLVSPSSTTNTLTTFTSNSTAAQNFNLPDLNADTLVSDSVVSANATQTLTKKTIDADQNTITNIENADIKAGANIARSKLATGATNKLVANDGVTGALSDVTDISLGTNSLVLSNTRHLEIQASDDSTTTGTNATLASFTAGAIRLTNASLVSIANIPAAPNGQQLAIFNRTGVSVKIKDESGAIGSATARIFTGSGSDIDLAVNAALFFQYDSTSSRWQVIGGSGSGAATSAIDNVFVINDATDATKQINFDANGTTGTKTTIATSPTASRTITLPDATDTLVGKATSDVLTNKTVVVANNTITTAASGNLLATELNAALSELQSDIDTRGINVDVLGVNDFESAQLSDFVQTGLVLSTTNPIKGSVSALLVHQAATNQSFKKTIGVPRKFRGKLMQHSVTIRSSASSSNVTLLVRDETNSADLLASSQITTGQITSAVFNTASSTTVTVTSNSILNQIKVGATITGSGIPSNTVVTAVGSSTITISNAATATATGVSLKVSVLPATQTFSYTIPANCSSISFTITALPESGSPESYFDDIQIALASSAKTTASITTAAAVLNDFAATVSGTSVTSTTSSWIQSVTNPSTGNYTVTFVSGIFSVAPAINITPGAQSGASGATASFISTSASSVSFIISNDTGAEFNSGFAIRASKQGADFTNPLTATTTTTIPLTSSVLVTQPDSQMTWQGLAGAGSTRTKVIYFTNARSMTGSAISYTSNVTNGLEVTVLEDGYYDISLLGTGSVSVNTTWGIGLNVIDFTSTINARFTDSTLLKVSYGNNSTNNRDSNSVSWSGPLKAGDKIYPMSDYSTVDITGTVYFSVSKVGSTKIINPSSDQKIAIPTHQLRFEGSTSRSTTDTGVVKFDTQTITQGDAFTVVNIPANGTVVTIKKAGILSISASLYLASTGQAWLTKNKSNLTTAAPSASEVLATIFAGSSAFMDVLSYTGPVSVGDVIRVTSNVNPSSEPGNQFNLSLQEQSVAVALQNVTPQWDQSDSAVRADTGAGFGSTNTLVRRYASIVDNTGGDVTAVQSSINGDSFVINTSGVYAVSCSDDCNSGVALVITKNQINATAGTNILANSSGTSQWITASSQVYLTKGDIIRVIASAPANILSASTSAKFSITKVGKTSGTVDVTPFVQIPQQDVEAIEALTSTSTFGSTNTGVPVLNITKNTNKGIIQIVSDSVNGTSFKALKDCTISVSSGGSTSAGGIFITKNATILTAGTPDGILVQNAITNSGNSIVSTTATINAGDIIRVQRNSGTSPIYQTVVTATAISSSVATPTQSVSSDTMSFVWSGTALTGNEAVGTFNTYTKAANANTATTLSASAPSQSISSMNINGILVTGYGYSSASTTATPSRFDIVIGKGLQSRQVDAFFGTGKTQPTSYDYVQGNASSVYQGCFHFYNPNTGILTIECQVPYASITSLTSGQLGNSYFVFNASKAPSLVTIPNLNQRVAYLSEQYASGTNGGTAVASTWTTKVLNTVVDNTGIVSSLASNQFVLPAGTYKITGFVALYRTNNSKIRLRNITAGTTALVGSSVGGETTGNVIPAIDGEVTITQTTTFALQYYCTTAYATAGLGAAMVSAENELYTQLAIIKIK